VTYWPLSVFAARLSVWRRDRKMLRNADRIGRDIGESVVKRWHETDERIDALIGARAGYWRSLGDR
jgi:hypothetical protein